MQERPKVAIVASEFFAPSLKRMGGFGWAAQAAATCIREDLGWDVMFIASAKVRWPEGEDVVDLDGAPLVLRGQDPWRSYARRVRDHRPALVLTIDFRNDFRPALLAMARTPVIMWIRDPRSSDEVSKVAGVRVPGDPTNVPPGLHSAKTDGLSPILRLSRVFKRPFVFASKAPQLVRERGDQAYGGVALGTVRFLGDPVILPSQNSHPPAERPRILFLGRRDPVKRPWLVRELARRLPDADFHVLGATHFKSHQKEGSQAPSNLRLLGHVEGAEKHRELSEAWIMLNTSVHEGLPVSFLEGLAYGISIVSCQDPEGVVSRFGRYVGRFDGDGIASLPAFESVLRELITNDRERVRLGMLGRTWVEGHHTRARFVRQFVEIQEGIRTGPLLPVATGLG